MESFDIVCFLYVAFMGLTFIGDCLGTIWSHFKKKPAESMLGGYLTKYPYWWWPIIRIVLFVYGIRALILYG